jgi:hypothetical protein
MAFTHETTDWTLDNGVKACNNVTVASREIKFSPVGEKAEFRESRTGLHLQRFKRSNLWLRLPTAIS